jgi:SH3-like domain-containing protein
MTLPRLIAGAALLLAAASGHAFDFRTVGATPAILYDAPSTKGKKLFVAPRGMPLEVVLSYGDWVKVRDVGGDLAWAERKALSEKRNVVARAAGLKVRTSADEAGTPVLMVDKDVLLEVVETAPAGWLKVRHRDGQAGYVRATEVWGI